MRSNKLLLLASLANAILALPTKDTRDLDPRTFGLAAEILHEFGSDLVTIVEDILGGGKSSASVLTNISARAAAALNGGALGCKAGVIDADIRAELATWIRAHAGFEASLKTELLTWCEGDASATLSTEVCAGLSLYVPTCAAKAAAGDLYVTIDGIFDVTTLEAGVVLSSSFQSSLATFISGSVGLELDANIRAGLSLCAGGGVHTDLHADLAAALKVWLNGSSCSLSASLKVAVLAWLEGKIETGVVAIGSIPTGGVTAVSVGAAISAWIEAEGSLSATAQAYLSAFLESSVSANIEADVQTVLEACIAGKLATSISADARAALAVWLSGSSCSLGAELKAALYLWLSFSVTEVSIDISSSLITELEVFLTGTIEASLGSSLRGTLWLLLSGESIIYLSLEARAELAAVLGGAVDIDISSSFNLLIIEWLTGCSIPGAPTISSGSGSTT
ncbi:putative cell wall protein, partial [Aspergillus saccharolyticus JOP 1030-1]